MDEEGYDSSDFCDQCGTELIDQCLWCGAPVCCPKCCEETRKENSDEQEDTK
jgi:hypothetical protein